MRYLLPLLFVASIASLRSVRADAVVAADDFHKGDAQWVSELEAGGSVEVREGKLEIDVPAGCTVWFKPKLTGPLSIEYDVTAISAGGSNDRVSDLNCFWMATDARSEAGGVLDVSRSGKFSDYDQLRCYYVGLGGNNNTTTRFRRYIGARGDRPLLPEHDLSDPQFLLKPNVTQHIKLVANGNLIQYWRDGNKIFEFNDAQPYTSGWFAFRTTKNHMTIQNFRVLHLAASGAAAPAHLRCEYRENPIGLTETKPRLSWWLSDDRRGAAQTAYQVQVGSAPDKSDLWDSGKVASNQSVHIEYNGSPLSSGQRAFWRVKTWDQDGVESPWSESATFEIGLLEASDWHAKWIGSNLAGSMNTSVPAPMLRKTFDVSQPITSARLYITALGLFDASINGQHVGDELLAPGFTDYRKRIAYRTYDVTKLLRSGKNAIGATLGDGWAIGFVGFLGRRQNFNIDGPLLFAQLQIATADGKTQTIATDESWRFAFGPVVSNDLLMGEAYNPRLEMPGWDTADFDDSSWVPAVVQQPKVGKLIASAARPVRAMKEIKPTDIKRVDARRGRYIVDMGQNMVGHVRLRIHNPQPNRLITIHGAEMLEPDGTPWFEGLRKAQATDSYQTKGGGSGDEVFEPRFTFHGFRYVQIEGYPGELKPEDITGVVVHSDTPPTGEFTCSDELINKLQHNIEWGQRGNFIDIPTDCPQRDERMGWMGDAQVFARTACYNMNVASFFEKWLDDVDDAQRNDGAFPSYAPHFSPDDGGPAWADAGVIVPWTVYECFGDTRVLERHYPAMQKFIAFLEQQHPNGIGDNRGYGDWLAMDNKTPKPLIGTAFFAHSADLMSRIANVLEKKDDAAKYRATFERVREAFNKEFVKPDGSIAGDTQTVYVLALHFDLLPENLRDQARQRLIDDVKKRDNHLSTGFVGTPYLSHVVPADVGYDLLMQKTFPSWLYPVTQGATTIWERWDGWTQDKGFQDAGMNSFNHYAYGAVGSWMYQTVAGIDLAEPGYKKLRIHPTPGGGLTSAEGKLQTPYGLAVSSWRREASGAIRYDLTIPPNTTAEVVLARSGSKGLMESEQPADRAQGVRSFQTEPEQFNFEVGAGTYHFVVSPAEAGR